MTVAPKNEVTQHDNVTKYREGDEPAVQAGVDDQTGEGNGAGNDIASAGASHAAANAKHTKNEDSKGEPQKQSFRSCYPAVIAHVKLCQFAAVVDAVNNKDRRLQTWTSIGQQLRINCHLFSSYHCSYYLGTNLHYGDGNFRSNYTRAGIK